MTNAASPNRTPFTLSVAAVVLIAFLVSSATPLGAVTNLPSAGALYMTASSETLERHISAISDGTTYVSTGDIDAEWLRDASAVGRAYIMTAQNDPRTARTLRGIIAREGKYILVDPYANAFSAGSKVVERKFELDSLLYPVWFAYAYWKATGDAGIFTHELHGAFDRILTVMRDEQRHDRRSHYRHPQLANNGRGSPTSYTGMVWTGFRPSDDPVRYQYNVPVNMLAVVVMRDLTQIERSVYRDGRQAANAWGLSVQIQHGIEQNAVVALPGFGRIYAYEVDGLGHANMMDDANVPSLLSIPYLGYLPAGDPVYRATRRFVLSDRNPYFYAGKYAQGIGSPHTQAGYVWPLALVMQAFTSTDDSEIERVLTYLLASDLGDHHLHESFDANRPESYTRGDFAWPNALYAELISARHEGGLE